jgi:hypothetical protein
MLYNLVRPHCSKNYVTEISRPHVSYMLLLLFQYKNGQLIPFTINQITKMDPRSKIKLFTNRTPGSTQSYFQKYKHMHPRSRKTKQFSAEPTNCLKQKIIPY